MVPVISAKTAVAQAAARRLVANRIAPEILTTSGAFCLDEPQFCLDCDFVSIPVLAAMNGL